MNWSVDVYVVEQNNNNDDVKDVDDDGDYNDDGNRIIIELDVSI